MNSRISTTRVGGHVLAMLGLVGALLTTSSGAVRAESSASGAGLVGTWRVQVTLRDCATEAPLGTFGSLVTFNEGGTVSESAGSLAFAAGQRTSGHGTWARRGGHTFRQRMIALILFETQPNLPGTPTFDPSLPITPGFFAGRVTVNHTVVLVDANHLTSAGTNKFYKTNGEVYREGCSTAEGQRF